MVKCIQDQSEIPMKGGVVIDFFATWCGPCKRIAPTYEKLSEAFPMITFLKCDVDESPDLVNLYDISAMPTFVFLKDGQIVKRVEGADLAGLEAGFSLLA
jgi:thioredoxin 1